MPSALGSLTDAGVLGDDQQVVQALGGVGPWRAWRSGSGISLGWCPAVVSGLMYLPAPSPRVLRRAGGRQPPGIVLTAGG
jgi:hypothetical protein